MSEVHLAVALHQVAPIRLDVELTCGPRDVVAIFGPSGSGKTTVLRTIAGLYRPTHATVRCGDDTWTDTSRGIFEPAHRRTVGFLFQEYALFPHLTALGNLTVALGHLPRRDRRARAETLLGLVHLTGRVDRRPHELSGGERQRVALARALARQPAVLLLDEPFAAVDGVVRRRLQEEIDTLRRSLGIPMVLVTHDFEDVVRLASHVLLLERGRTVAAGPIATLMSRPDLPWLREAVGLGAVFDARVTRADGDYGLAELDFVGGTLLATVPHAVVGAIVRVRIPAREVILAIRPPDAVSVHNIVSGRISSVHVDPAFPHVMVQVAVGRVFLLAEVTRDGVDRLGLAVGGHVYALIKSVSIDVRAPTHAPEVDIHAGAVAHQ